MPFFLNFTKIFYTRQNKYIPKNTDCRTQNQSSNCVYIVRRKEEKHMSKLENIQRKFIGIDYKILSLEYFDEDTDLAFPVGRKYGLKVPDVMEKSRKKGLKPSKYLRELLNEETIYESPSPNMMGEDFEAVKIKSHQIDYDLIVDCGLGLIQMYDGGYYIYNAYNKYELTKIAIKIYMSIVDSTYYNAEVENLIKNGKAEEVINQFKMSDFVIHPLLVKSYESKKSNVIEVDFKCE